MATFAPRLKGGWWNNPKAFPKTRLYLNVLSEAEENELGMRYDFRMLREPVTQPDDGSAYWFPVSRLFEIEDIADLMAEVANHNLGNNKAASRLLGDMWKSIHNAGTLYFYEETDQDVEKVLDIFIRVNSGGTTLSYSDLLLSIATAQWGGTRRPRGDQLASGRAERGGAGISILKGRRAEERAGPHRRK